MVHLVKSFRIFFHKHERSNVVNWKDFRLKTEDNFVDFFLLVLLVFFLNLALYHFFPRSEIELNFFFL
jgi:hypothetical protein